MWVAYRDKTTGKINAVFENCITNSTHWENELLFTKEIFTENKPNIDASLIPQPQPKQTLNEKIRGIVQEELIKAGVVFDPNK